MAATAARSLAYEAAEAALLRCNSYSRIQKLYDLWGELELEDWEWLTLLGDWWSLCDNIGPMAELFDDTPFADAVEYPGFRQWLMTAEEQAGLAALPEEVTVYRGCYASNKWGLSWSLDRAVAAKFPTLHRYRQGGQPLLVKARVARSDIIALKLCRNEAEIIAIRPKHVSTSHIR